MASAAVRRGVVRWPRLLTPPLLIQILRRQKNPVTALEIFNSVPDHLRTAPVYSTILNHHANLPSSSSSSPQTKTIVHDMIHRGSCRCPDWIFERVIARLVNDGKFEDAIEVFEEIPNSNCVDWSASFQTLFHSLVENRRFMDSVKLLRKVCNNGGIGVKWKVGTFNMVISALCGMKRPEFALEVFVEMNEHCCFPDRETYRILMKSLCESKRLEEATHLLYSMLWRISQKGCDADVVVYRLLLEALCKEGEVEKAEEVLSKILKKGLRIPRLRRCFQRWEITGANIEEMKESINAALVRGGVRSATSYSAVIEDLYSEGKVEDADRLVDEMAQKRGFVPKVSTYEAKISALRKEGRTEKDGIRVLEEEMVRTGCAPAISTYNSVMEGLCKEGRGLMAMSVLRRMKRTNKESYEIVVNGLCCESRYIEACNVMERMLVKKHLPCSGMFGELIKGLCSIGRSYEAVVYLEEMVVRQGKVPECDVWTSLVSMATCNATWSHQLDMLLCLDPEKWKFSGLNDHGLQCHPT